jgi:arylsulfatase A-like enzyme
MMDEHENVRILHTFRNVSRVQELHGLGLDVFRASIEKYRDMNAVLPHSRRNIHMEPNIIVVVSDTLRAADVGCYGSTITRTPAMDDFARSGVQFTKAYPESLPTIPVRRALHTGRRAYPFRDYNPVKWDIVTLPGWQPMSNNEGTLAEDLADAGYQTGFVTDTLPYFAPGFNFTRGFWQWEYIRGQQQDRWRSPYSVPADTIANYCDIGEDRHSLIPMHLANTAHVESEADTSTARTFQWAMQFLHDNRAGQPFYLMVDCFDPHEPWEAPPEYYAMYGPREYSGRRIVHCGYGPREQFGYTDEEIAFVRAHYRGLTTLVDTWFGKLMRTLEVLGLAENTAVFVISDHGTNFCENPRDIIGKPANAMYPGVAHIPFIARFPDGTGAGTACDEITYNIDLTATAYDIAGVTPGQSIDGQSLLPVVRGEQAGHDYATCRYHQSVICVDKTTWAMGDIHGQPGEVFDLELDPDCMNDILSSAGDRWKTAWQRIIDDADGELPDYERVDRTDAIGEKPAR